MNSQTIFNKFKDYYKENYATENCLETEITLVMENYDLNIRFLKEKSEELNLRFPSYEPWAFAEMKEQVSNCKQIFVFFSFHKQLYMFETKILTNRNRQMNTNCNLSEMDIRRGVEFTEINGNQLTKAKRTEMKKLINEIVTFVQEIPAYRLYFVTGQIELDTTYISAQIG